MRKSIKLFPFFSLFVIFSDELFYSFISLFGVSLESGMKAREAIFIAAISYLLIAFDFIAGKFSRRNLLQFFSLIVILVLYLLTGYFYSPSSSDYWSQFLAYGALSIPSCYVGMRLVRENYDKEFLNAMPLFVLVVSIIVGRAILTKSIGGELLGRDGDNVGFNYQNASYYLAFCYSYCLYYLLFVGRRLEKAFSRQLLYFVMMALLLFCAICCLSGGGRGAFVYLVAISIYLVLRSLQKVKVVVKVGIIFFVLIAYVALFFIAKQLGVFSSEGFLRVTETLTIDPIRTKLLHDAILAFRESPIIGRGLGSIWWVLGFYSHNIVTDLLVETGIIGTVFISSILITCLIRLVRRSRTNRLSMFILILFLGTLTEVSFSGYWLSSSKLFLVFGFVYAIGRSQYKHTPTGK